MSSKAPSIWSLQRQLSRNLLVWSALSVGIGVALLPDIFSWSTPFWRGVGLQGVVWGVIDAGIAVFGLVALRRRRARLDDPYAPQSAEREARKLRKLLLVNAGLDVLYIAGGVALTLTFGSGDGFARGNGVGIVVQGAFLLLFDIFYAQRTKRCLYGIRQTSQA